MPDVVTDTDREALRRYGAGADLGDIARDLGIPRERLGLRMAHLCNLNRNHARELSRTAPVPHRPIRGRRPDPDPAELDRVDQAFAEVFVRKSPHLAVLVDAARALDAKAKQTGSAFFQTPWHETTQLRRALAALDGTDPPVIGAAPARTPQPDLAPEPVAPTQTADPLERWSAHRCPTCRWIGPFIDDYQHTDCPGHLQPVALLVVPREAG